LNVGKPSGDTPFGNIASAGAISEKPSHLLNSVGSTMMPSAFVGMASRGMSTRYPVADEASAFAYAIDGHGNMQPCPPSGLHSSGIPLESLPPHAAKRRTETTKPLIAATLSPSIPRRKTDISGLRLGAAHVRHLTLWP